MTRNIADAFLTAFGVLFAVGILVAGFLGFVHAIAG